MESRFLSSFQLRLSGERRLSERLPLANAFGFVKDAKIHSKPAKREITLDANLGKKAQDSS